MQIFDTDIKKEFYYYEVCPCKEQKSYFELFSGPVFSSVLGAFLGGALIDQAGVNAMLIFGTVAALIGALLLLFSAQKSRS